MLLSKKCEKVGSCVYAVLCCALLRACNRRPQLRSFKRLGRMLCCAVLCCDVMCCAVLRRVTLL